MAFDFGTLKTAVTDRGFEYLSAARVGQFVNDAIHEINDLEPWLYLQASTTGTSPVTISDLGRIESVVDVSNRNPLGFMDRRDVTDYHADLTDTSSVPDYYFVTGGTVVNTYPVSTVTLTIRYTKVGTALSNTTDTPDMPDRFRPAIIEYAVAQAFRDASNWEAAAQARAAGDQIVRRMVEWNTLSQGMGTSQRITGASEDW